MLSAHMIIQVQTALTSFMQQGGVVLWGLAAVLLIMMILIAERYLFIYFTFPSVRNEAKKRWDERHDQHSWYARVIRDRWIDVAHRQLYRNLTLIKGLVTICPMLGLLGTVTGMISVFDVMAEQGSGDAKLMAAGISLATLPTMAGMVAALPGMFLHARLAKRCELLETKLEKALRSQE